jgi:hypothetical protein
MPFTEAGVELLDEGGLLRGQLDRPLVVGLLAFCSASQCSAFVPSLLASARIVPPSPRVGGLRMALVDRRQVLQTLEALGREPPLPLIEADAVLPR